MKDRHLESKPACSVQSPPVPDMIKCPQCAVEIEMWSDETEAECHVCGCMVHRYNS